MSNILLIIKHLIPIALVIRKRKSYSHNKLHTKKKKYMFTLSTYSAYLVELLCVSINLFSVSRSRGFNNNPTCLQFKRNIRKPLFFNCIKGSPIANCTNILNENVVIFIFKIKILNSINNKCEIEAEDIDLIYLFNLPDSYNISFYLNNTLFYICGSIIRKFVSKYLCVHCINYCIQKKINK